MIDAARAKKDRFRMETNSAARIFAAVIGNIFAEINRYALMIYIAALYSTRSSKLLLLVLPL